MCPAQGLLEGACLLQEMAQSPPWMSRAEAWPSCPQPPGAAGGGVRAAPHCPQCTAFNAVSLTQSSSPPPPPPPLWQQCHPKNKNPLFPNLYNKKNTEALNKIRLVIHSSGYKSHVLISLQCKESVSYRNGSIVYPLLRLLSFFCSGIILRGVLESCPFWIGFVIRY